MVFSKITGNYSGCRPVSSLLPHAPLYPLCTHPFSQHPSKPGHLTWSRLFFKPSINPGHDLDAPDLGGRNSVDLQVLIEDSITEIKSMQQNQRCWLFYFRHYSSLSKLDPYITHNSNSQLTSVSEICACHASCGWCTILEEWATDVCWAHIFLIF